jgi:hypothetical protein
MAHLFAKKSITDWRPGRARFAWHFDVIVEILVSRAKGDYETVDTRGIKPSTSGKA